MFWGFTGLRYHEVNHANMNPDTNYIAPPAGPSHVQVVGTYGWIGCYTEATNIRTLSSKSFTNASMTAEQCVGFCSGYGYAYAGVEYGTQCM